jgi:hypothetical protein
MLLKEHVFSPEGYQMLESDLLYVGLAAPPGTMPIFPALISMTVLAAALYVILSKKYPPKVEHWAYATIGTVLGFWLRQA